MVAVAAGPELIVNFIDDGNQYRPFLTSLSTGGYLVGWQDTSGLGSPPGDISDDVRFALYDTFGNRLTSGDTIANTQKLSSQFEGQGAALKDGKYVLVWTDDGATAPAGSVFTEANAGIKLQIFDADGTPSGDEVLVNPNSSSSALRQDQPSVAALQNGKIIVTWTTQDVNASSTTNISGRLFNSDGSPAGDEFTVNVQTLGDQENSTVHALSSGGFAVVWDDRESSLITGNETHTFIRFYNANGGAQGVPLEANSANSGDPQEVSFTELTDGRIVITWTENQTSAPGDASGSSVRARIYDPVTQGFGGSFRVNTRTSRDQNDAQIAALDHGQFVVVWTDDSRSGGDTSFQAVRMQVFDSTGAKVGSEILVNSESTFEQKNPVVTVLPDYRFVVAWEDNSQTGSDQMGYAIHSRIFDARIAGIDITGDAAGNDYVGSDFADVIRGQAGADQLFGGAGFDLLIGGKGRDRLQGDNGSDDLRGGTGNDILIGGNGNDTLDGNQGADKMIGGPGDDTYYVDDPGDVVIEKANEGIDTVKTTLSSYVLPNNVERLIFIGNGSFTGQGNKLDNTITGGDSDDLFKSDSGGADTFNGRGGLDTMDFRLSTKAVKLNLDTGVHGGAAAGDTFISIEKFYGSANADIMKGGSAAVTLFGMSGDDTLTGGNKSDTIQGGTGNDTMRGGGGADVFVFTEIILPPFGVGFGHDDIYGFQDGVDTLRFSTVIAQSIGNITISGNGTTDVMLQTLHGSVTLHAATAITITAADLDFF
ncbi:MAG: hypothetical protein KDK75_16420 [Alphaproteobacteria bacterium]|nr:hypothetical protein [Alphaproteobacteria bacterium]